jgi:hypothetical protein
MAIATRYNTFVVKKSSIEAKYRGGLARFRHRWMVRPPQPCCEDDYLIAFSSMGWYFDVVIDDLDAYGFIPDVDYALPSVGGTPEKVDWLEWEYSGISSAIVWFKGTFAGEVVQTDMPDCSQGDLLAAEFFHDLVALADWYIRTGSTEFNDCREQMVTTFLDEGIELPHYATLLQVYETAREIQDQSVRVEGKKGVGEEVEVLKEPFENDGSLYRVVKDAKGLVYSEVWNGTQWVHSLNRDISISNSMETPSAHSVSMLIRRLVERTKGIPVRKSIGEMTWEEWKAEGEKMRREHNYQQDEGKNLRELRPAGTKEVSRRRLVGRRLIEESGRSQYHE